jgi:drug/metabolite transporter (DMT)-like permease
MMVYLKLLLTAVFWGGTFIAGRAIAGTVEPFSAAFLRFLTASLCLVAITIVKDGGLSPPRRDQILPTLLLDLTGVFAYNAFFFKGLQDGHRRPRLGDHRQQSGADRRFRHPYLRGKNDPSQGRRHPSVGNGRHRRCLERQPGAVAGWRHSGWGRLMIFGCVLSWVCFSLIGKAIMQGMSPLRSVTLSAIAGTAFLLVPAAHEGVFSALWHYD